MEPNLWLINLLVKGMFDSLMSSTPRWQKSEILVIILEGVLSESSMSRGYNLNDFFR